MARPAVTGQPATGQPLNRAQAIHFAGIAEGPGDPSRSGATCTADPVYVALGHVWYIEINDMRDFRHVDATSRNIGCDQHAHVPIAKGGQRFHASFCGRSP